MEIKYIFLVSFLATGGLMYLLRQPAQSGSAKPPLASPEADIPAPLPKAQTRLAAKAPALSENPLASKDAPLGARYAELLPERSQLKAPIQAPRERKFDFIESVVRPDFNRCFKNLVQRRNEIYEGRDGDAELSFAGEVQLHVRFVEGAVDWLQAKSNEVREDTYLNCIESHAKQWKFPDELKVRGEWKYRQNIAYDVNYEYLCKNGRTSGVVLPSQAQIRTSVCLP